MSYLQAGHVPNPNMSGAIPHLIKGAMMQTVEPNARQQNIIIELERLVATGDHHATQEFFSTWSTIPDRLGDWQLRVNYRRADRAIVGRTVVALPLTVRTRAIFEQGRMLFLEEKGFSKEDAARYYKLAWKRQYVWVETVVVAVSEMIQAFRTPDVPSSFLVTGDPRRLADSVNVPKNPFLVSHAHFLVAVEMAVGVIKARMRQECEVN